MVDSSLNRSNIPPKPFVRLCNWLWSKQKFIWSGIVLGLVLNVLASLFFISWPWSTNPNLKGTLFQWVLQNPLIVMMVGIFILLVIAIIYLGSRFDTPTTVPTQKTLEVISSISEKPIHDPDKQLENGIDTLLEKPARFVEEIPSIANESAQSQDKKIETLYLERVILITKPLTFTGIPSNLIIEPVSLDEVFIPLELRHNRPLTDYPLTENQIRSYQEELQRSDISPERRRRIEQALLASETSWQRKLKSNARISTSELWRIQSKTRLPVVIQGYPGMGKTTLMLRLTLHAARSSLGKPDPTMPERLRPALIPVLVSLGDYANELLSVGELSLFNYIGIILNKLNIPGVFSVFQKRLKEGRCLVLLDGLDEVPQNIRKQVQQAIRTFVSENLLISSETNPFNRILITSRVAGYDQEAFPTYSHYTLAELSQKQREDFLRYWSYAYVRHIAASESSNEQAEGVLTKEAERITKDLAEAINYHGDLTENPLLLTLLAVMKQNSIELPKRRVELYRNVTLILLEKRNIIRNIPPIPEVQAIQRLGPLAYQMHEQGTNLIQEIDVIKSLKETIGNEGSNSEDTEQEARIFLKRIRERGGIFVQRAGDYFGFFHRTFQEYFVARYILNEIGRGNISVQDFIEKVLYDYGIWREPLLLAVALNSGESDNKISYTIIHTLLDCSKSADIQNREQSLLLTVDCLIEAKPLSIDYNLEQNVAEQLLSLYEQAQKQQQTVQICINIEETILKWLVNLPLEIHQSSLVTTLVKVIEDFNQTTRQLAALTLTTAIAGRLDVCPPIVIKKLTDALLGLTKPSLIVGNMPTKTLPITPSLISIDLSLLALSFLGKQGVTGLLLTDIRKHFENHPQHLNYLAQISLSSKILLSPVATPLDPAHFQNYQIAIEKWKELLSHQESNTDEQNIDSCINILKDLLACAEEARYPMSIFLLNMLKATDSSFRLQQEPLQTIVQNYLLGEVQEGRYINYLLATLIYQSLFPEIQAQPQARIYDYISEEFTYDNQPLQPYARHFISILSNDLKDIYYAWKLKGPRERKNYKCLAEIGCLSMMWYLQEYVELLKLKGILRIYEMQGPRSLENLRSQLNLRDIKALDRVRSFLLCSTITDKTIKMLSQARVRSMDPSICIELLTVLLGRTLQILVNDDKKADAEIKNISLAACASFTDFDNAEVRGATLEILAFLPARTTNEIKALLKLAEESPVEEIQKACSLSIQRSNPVSPAAWNALAAGTTSKIKTVQAAVETRFKQRK